jgi:hypothetical protein
VVGEKEREKREEFKGSREERGEGSKKECYIWTNC